MGDNIFLKEMKEIQFEDYFKYDAKCRGNLGDELPVMVYRMLEYSLKDELKNRFGKEVQIEVFRMQDVKPENILQKTCWIWMCRWISLSMNFRKKCRS